MGVSESIIEGASTVPGRVSAVQTRELLAAIFAIEPGTFYEYPIAAARCAAREARIRRA